MNILEMETNILFDKPCLAGNILHHKAYLLHSYGQIAMTTFMTQDNYLYQSTKASD